MKLVEATYQIGPTDDAEIFTSAGNQLLVGGAGSVVLFFPDRTPHKNMLAVAKAINDALAAAREIDGAGRD